MKKVLNIYHKYEEIINYLIFGFLTTLISLIVYYGLVYTFLNPNKPILLQIANILSWIAGVTFAYVTNKKYVFKSNNKNIKKELSSFLLARLVTLFIDMLIMFIGVTILNGNDKIIKILSQIIVIVSNYLFSKLFIFKKKEG